MKKGLQAGALLAVLALAGVSPAPAQQAPGFREVQAEELLRIASRSLAGARREAGKAAPAPLRAAFDEAERALDRVSRALAARDLAFYRALSEGDRSLARLRVAGVRSGIDDPGFRRQMGDLMDSYSMLRGDYGWEAVRWSQGRPLSEGERQRFRELQRVHRRLAQRLGRVADRARHDGDRRAAEEAGRLARQATRLAASPPTLSAYLSVIRLTDSLLGQWAGHAAAPERRLRTAWEAADTAAREVEEVADAVFDEEAGFLFAADLGAAPRGGWLAARKPAAAPPATDLDEQNGEAGGEPEPGLVHEAATTGGAGETNAATRVSAGPQDESPPIETSEEPGYVGEASEAEAESAEAHQQPSWDAEGEPQEMEPAESAEDTFPGEDVDLDTADPADPADAAEAADAANAGDTALDAGGEVEEGSDGASEAEISSADPAGDGERDAVEAESEPATAASPPPASIS